MEEKNDGRMDGMKEKTNIYKDRSKDGKIGCREGEKDRRKEECIEGWKEEGRSFSQLFPV